MAEGLRIDFRRSGGFAGITLRSSIDTGQLPPEEAREIEELVRGIDLRSIGGRAPRPGRGADRFQYDLTIEQQDERSHLSFGDGEVPPEIRPLVDRMLRLARRR